MNKYIFLDMDGVMLPFPEKGKELPFETLENLMMLTDSVPNCLVVISSDWRMAFSLDELRSAFPEDMRELIIGMTDILEHTPDNPSTKRDREIAKYVNDNDIDPEDCVAFDDAWPITCVPFVMCDGNTGLTKELALEAFDYLAGNKPFYDINQEVVQLEDF